MSIDLTRPRASSPRSWTRSAWSLVLLLGASVALSDGDWPGFRGGDRQGWSRDAAGPVHWSTNQQVAWKTPIHGQGHSSPVVSGGSIYVTSAYPSPRHQALRGGVRWGMTALAVILLAVSVSRLRAKRGANVANKPDRDWRTMIWVPGGIALSVGVLVAVWGGPRLLGLDTHDVRAWQFSLLIALLSLVVAGLAWPARSRAGLVLGVLSLVLTLPAWLWFPERDELFPIDGVSAAASLLLVVFPTCLGLGFGLRHLLVRRRAADTAALAARGTSVAVWMPAAVAVVLGALYFVDANYLRRTKDLVRAVVCLGLEDGRVRWTATGLSGPQRPLTAMNTPATPTPATDGQRVVASFASAGLMCVDREGRLLWSKAELASEPIYGTATSPLLHDGVVVVVNDVEEGKESAGGPRSWIAALDVHTGALLWRRERTGHPRFAGYATPIIETRGATNVVWVVGWQGIEGYALRTGDTVGRHSYELTAHHLAASPAIEGDRLFVTGATRHLCLDLTKLRGGGDPVVWSQPARGEVSASPVVADGLAFIVAENGQASCLDLATGQRLWERRLPKRHFASVVATGNQVYFSSENGGISVVARQADLNVLAENSLGERIYATPAPVGERLLVRTVDHLWCLTR